MATFSDHHQPAGGLDQIVGTRYQREDLFQRMSFLFLLCVSEKEDNNVQASGIRHSFTFLAAFIVLTVMNPKMFQIAIEKGTGREFSTLEGGQTMGRQNPNI